MKGSPVVCRALAAALLAAALPVHAGPPGPVTVRYAHPEQFTETREVRAFAPARANEEYLDTLKRYIEKRAAKKLAPGQMLDIVVTDVDRAGSYLPTITSPYPVRVVKDIYPPRIVLRFRLRDAGGRVAREGERRLTDPGFMYDGIGHATDTDALRYEKNLIDRWLARGPDRL